jgi:chromosome segregation ATPase
MSARSLSLAVNPSAGGFPAQACRRRCAAACTRHDGPFMIVGYPTSAAGFVGSFFLDDDLANLFTVAFLVLGIVTLIGHYFARKDANLERIKKATVHIQQVNREAQPTITKAQDVVLEIQGERFDWKAQAEKLGAERDQLAQLVKTTADQTDELRRENQTLKEQLQTFGSSLELQGPQIQKLQEVIQDLRRHLEQANSSHSQLDTVVGVMQAQTTDLEKEGKSLERSIERIDSRLDSDIQALAEQISRAEVFSNGLAEKLRAFEELNRSLQEKAYQFGSKIDQNLDETTAQLTQLNTKYQQSQEALAKTKLAYDALLEKYERERSARSQEREKFEGLLQQFQTSGTNLNKISGDITTSLSSPSSLLEKAADTVSGLNAAASKAHIETEEIERL